MQKEIYLLRHGQSEANAAGVLAGWTDAALTETGHQQAKEAAARLVTLLEEEGRNSGKSLGLEAILSSDLKRAMDTAAPIAALLGLTVEPHSSLRELHLGRWENKTFDSVKAEEPELAALWLKQGMNFVYPEGESLEHVMQRAIPVVEAALEGRDKILVVAHGGVLSGLIAHYVFSDVTQAKGIYVHNGCFSRIVVHGSGATLNLLNY